MTEQTFLHALKKQVGDTDSILLAVSGGRDSVVLLDLFARYHPKPLLVVGHFDHRSREGSRSDADWVGRLAGSLDIEFQLGVSSHSGPRSENAFREERLAFLERTASQRGCSSIATAHHADDQLETFLLRVLRGAGLRGLGGMAPRRGKLIRPLLSCPREELARYAEQRGLSWVEDPTNLEPRFLRNRVRHELIPLLAELASGFGGEAGLRRRIEGLCEEVREVHGREVQSLRETLGKSWIETPFWTRIPSESFFSLPNEQQATLVKFLAGPNDSSRPRVHFLLGLLQKGRRGGELEGGFRVRRSCGQIFFQTLAQRQTLEVAEPPHLGIRAKWCTPAAQIRFARPGDGLRKFFRRRRVPLPERALWPVLADDAKIHAVYPHSSVGIVWEPAAFPFTA